MPEALADLAPVVDRIEADLDASVERLKTLLSIPSVSTDPAFNDETRRAAQWCADQLTELGFASTVRDTTGHPMVVAKRHDTPRPDVPHLLYYGHYDVQPPDPLDEWDSPPFEPTVVEGEHGRRIVARGAVDDKGQLMTFVEAFRAWIAVHGSLPVNVTVLLEGEEESGSPSLDPFLEANRDELQADACVVCDTGMWNIETPAITHMLRGLVYVDIRLLGPSHDLHSGMYGGGVVNPINALTEILGDLHDEQGCVRIPGFYDDVRDVTPEQRAQWDTLGFDEAAFLASAGLDTSIGEAGYSLLERVWARPTCDLNGIWGGYQGEGAKTVIAAHASAKLSCRLVADQDPQKIMAGVRRFLDERTPPGCRWEIVPHGCNPAIQVPVDSQYLAAALDGLRHTFGCEPVVIGTGGSIPLVGSIREILGFDSLLVGFGLDDDRVHSPNEKFELRCFENGIKSHAAMLEAFGRLSRQVLSDP